jgi:hypothetical protein
MFLTAAGKILNLKPPSASVYIMLVFQTLLNLGSLNKKYVVKNKSIYLCPKL